MKLATALLASLTVTYTAGFQPTLRCVSTVTHQSATKLFMSDEIKDYKKGLSKITGQGETGNKVSCAVVSCLGLKVCISFSVRRTEIHSEIAPHKLCFQIRRKFTCER